MSKASEQQRKMFFALCKELNHDAERATQRVKAKYGLQSFKDVETKQLSEVIDALKGEHQKKVTPQIAHEHRFVCECGKVLVVEK